MQTGKNCADFCLSLNNKALIIENVRINNTSLLFHPYLVYDDFDVSVTCRMQCPLHYKGCGCMEVKNIWRLGSRSLSVTSHARLCPLSLCKCVRKKAKRHLRSFYRQKMAPRSSSIVLYRVSGNDTREGKT